MATLPQSLYSVTDLRELERYAVERCGMPESLLMERAGEAVWRAVRESWPFARSLLVICGTGNNGGDGFVAARMACAGGLKVQVRLVGEEAGIRGAARIALTGLTQAELRPLPFTMPVEGEVDVVVDALLGIGVNRDLEGVHRAAVSWMNQQPVPVIAVDIPSGLHADSGHILGVAVKACRTVSLMALKRGMYTGVGPEYCGDIVFDDLGIPKEGLSMLSAAAFRLVSTSVMEWLPPRPRSAHKGYYGHVLVMGGAPGTAGAARMAGEAALRVGSGLVSIATHPSHAPYLTIDRPELMCHGIDDAGALAPFLKRASVVALGPGMSTGMWGQMMMNAALDSGRCLVVDADALNLLAEEPLYRDDWVLTPHPGEAARLLHINTTEVQADRYAAVVALQRRYGGVVVLKGSGSLISDGKMPVAVCGSGNPGMASGGMGDVLTGVIAGLWAQGLTAWQAACTGVFVHGVAGDTAAQQGERGMLAGDLFNVLRRTVNPSQP